MQRIRAEVEAAVAEIAGRDHALFYSLTIALELKRPFVIPQLPRDHLIWGRPEHNHYRIGLGTALKWQAAGPERFEKLQREYDRICANWQHDCQTVHSYQPGVFCAFAFDADDPMTGPWQGLANTFFTIPELLLELRDGHYYLTFSCKSSQIKQQPKRLIQLQQWFNLTQQLLTALEAQPREQSDIALNGVPEMDHRNQWFSLVNGAKKAIHEQQLAKVVTARHLSLQTDSPLDEISILNYLAKKYPTCLLLGLSFGDKTVVAATPERMIGLEHGTIYCDALGGTSESSDDTLQSKQETESLLQNIKLRHEHQLVVDHLQQRLLALCNQLSIPDIPKLMPLGSLQHLWTPIEGKCFPKVSLFDLIAALHPTPAVAGTPAAEAQRWIAAHEPFHRGWYSGGVGWIQADGNGEVAVLLRTALISGRHIDLYAGAGIVADSDPIAEWNETELKLNAVLAAFGHTTRSLSENRESVI